MSTVLPFEPNPRRRSPAAALRHLPLEVSRDVSREVVRELPRDVPRGRVERAPAGNERVVPLTVHREPTTTTWVERAAPESAAAADPAPIGELAIAIRFAPIVLLAALLDLATKAIAVAYLDAGSWIGGTLGLHLVYNDASAGGVWLGAHTRAINVAATGTVIGLLLMLVPTLARLDRRSITAVALIVGGGVGNFASLISSDRGVPDFLAIRDGVGAYVLNVADVIMLAGIVLLGRTVAVVVRLMRAHGLRARVDVARPALVADRAR